MKCRLVRNHLNEHAAGQLPAQLQGQVGEHLQQCPLCRERLRDLQSVSQFVQTWVVPDPPAAWDARVMAAIQAGQIKQAGWFTPRPGWFKPAFSYGRLGAALAASAAVMVALVFLPPTWFTPDAGAVIRAALPTTMLLPATWSDASNAQSVPNALLAQDAPEPAATGLRADNDLDWADRMILRSSFRNSNVAGLPVLPASQRGNAEKMVHVIDFSTDTVQIVSRLDVASF